MALPYTGPAEPTAMTDADEPNYAEKRHSPALRSLTAFARNELAPYRAAKGDEKINIIDQGEKIAYAAPKSVIRTLMPKLEACRIEGVAAHFSERQGGAVELYSGIMHDFDLICLRKPEPLSARQYHRMTLSFAERLRADVDLSAPRRLDDDTPVAAPAEVKFLVFFIIKTAPVKIITPAKFASDTAAYDTKLDSIREVKGAGLVDTKHVARPSEGPPATSVSGGQGPPVGDVARWKYGLHALIPGVAVTRGVKKYGIAALNADPELRRVVAEITGEAGAPTACLDPNSASVPVLFFGCCKRDAIPYVFGAAFEVSIADRGRGAVIARQVSQEELAPYCLAAELSLTVEAPAGANAPPRGAGGANAPVLVPKMRYAVRDEIAGAVRDFGERNAAGVAAEELLFTETGLSTLCSNDAEARMLHEILALLPEQYYIDYAKWRDVIFALANTSSTYRPLAEWFSQKCPAKWAVGGAESLDALWNAAALRGSADAATGPPRVTKRSLIHWAKEAAPEAYHALAARSYFRVLMTYVYEHGGDLGHYMVAHVLHVMLGPKFCVDIDSIGRGAAAYSWFEFVSEGQAMRRGEVWKWRREEVPDTIMIYMSEQLPKVLNTVSEDLKERMASAKTEEQAKYYKKLDAAFAVSKRRVFNNQFKVAVLREANALFRRRGFAESLDKPGKYIGVGNGVGRLGPQCSLITGFHEIPISKFTTTNWRRFDPRRNPWDAIVLGAFATIIPEADARDWILFFIASSLDGDPKEGLILNWEGGGANGKTSILRAVASAMGKYARKIAITLFTSEREASDKPNSALMAYKDLRFGYVEELNKAEQCNVARLKEIVNPGVVTGSEKYGRQEDFTIVANTIVASQYSFGIDTRDHGTWRRITQYKSKIKFKARPDPANPFEKPEDQRFVREYPGNSDFLEAILAMLVFYYERLQREYRGEVKNIHSNTIRRETEAYRNSQDTLNRFITERIVLSPESDTTYPISSVGASYASWYTAHIDHKKHVAADVIKELESSVVSKYLKLGGTRTLQLVGCRILTPDTAEVFDGEDHLTLVEMRGKQTLAEWEEECAASDAFKAGLPIAAAAGAGADPNLWWQGRVYMAGDVATNYVDEAVAKVDADYKPAGVAVHDAKNETVAVLRAEDNAVLRAERLAEDARRRPKPAVAVAGDAVEDLFAGDDTKGAGDAVLSTDDAPRNDSAKPKRLPPPWRKFDADGKIIYPPPKYVEEDTKGGPGPGGVKRPPPWRTFDADGKIVMATTESRNRAAAKAAAELAKATAASATAAAARLAGKHPVVERAGARHGTAAPRKPFVPRPPKKAPEPPATLDDMFD